MAMTFVIKNQSGKVWTGSGWGEIPAAFKGTDLCFLDLDAEINPATFFDNSTPERIEIGWGDEAGSIFARAYAQQ